MHTKHTFFRLSVSAVIAIIGLTLSMLTFAATGDTVDEGIGVIIIKQENVHNGQIGTWTLIKPDQSRSVGDAAEKKLVNMKAGAYTLIANQPKGMKGTIRLYRNGTQVQEVPRPQISFPLAAEEEVMISIHYTPVSTGTVSVQTDPQGIDFRLKGPNGFEDEGTTPGAYLEMPIGDYTVWFDGLEGCKTPPPLSDVLVKDQRISFSVIMQCATADAMREAAAKKGTAEGYVSVTIAGVNVIFWDVPEETWFSPYIYRTAQLNILAGYKDENGYYTGKFGPENSVTLAELAKVAHKTASVSEDAFIGRNPENPAAAGAWFSPFIASAESRGWLVYQDTALDPLRPATRAEVVATLMQALDVAPVWPKGNTFADITPRTLYAGPIEAAARDGIVQGEISGSGTVIFRPEDPINRAELSKLIGTTLEVYRGVEETTAEE